MQVIYASLNNEQWHEYSDGWSNSPRRPAWTPGRQFNDLQTDTYLLRADAEERHKKALVQAIRSGSCVPLSHAGTPLDEGEREFLSLGHLSFEKLREHTEKTGILVSIESTIDATNVVEEAADGILKATRVQWEGNVDRDGRQEIARAFIERHVLDHLRELVASGAIVPRNPNDDLPLNGPLDFGFAVDLHWKITAGDAAKLHLEINNHPTQNLEASVANAAQKSETNRRIRDANLAEKKSAGRYTIKEACAELFKATGIYADRWRATMLDSIQKGELPLRNPRDYSDRLPYAVPKIIRSFEEQVDTDGLNAWLERHKEWGVTFRFSKVPPAIAPPAERPDRRGEATWIEEARSIALAYLVSHKERDLHPSQADVCRHVAEEMRKRMSYGVNGAPVTAAYIQRNAIQGSWWRKARETRETRES